MKTIFSTFYKGADPINLGYFRFTFCFLCILRFLFVPWSLYADTPKEIWNPPGIFEWVLFSPPSYQFIQITVFMMYVSVFSLMIGLLTRLASIVAFFSVFINLGITHSSFYFDHSTNCLVICFLIFMFAPAIGQTFSIDNILRMKRRSVRLDDQEFIWPQRLVQFLFFNIFFASGVSKIIHSGFSWFESDNIIGILNFTKTHFSDLKVLSIQDSVNFYIKSSPILAKTLGIGVVVMEISAGFFFYKIKYLKLGLGIVITLHLGIFLCTYIPFVSFLPLYAIFLPYSKTNEALKKMRLYKVSKKASYET